MKTFDSDVVDLIWNISLICPWDCAFCCTDAVHVGASKGGLVQLREQSLAKIRFAPATRELPSHLQPFARRLNRFDFALLDRQHRGLELNYAQKLTVLDNLASSNVEIDFAGGDPLACYENFLIMKEAARRFGRESISITSTGANWTRYDIEEVASLIGEFEFTFDEPIDDKVNRPKSYNNANLSMAQKFSSLGIATKAQAPLHSGNVSDPAVASVFEALNDAGIDELLLMRLFPVGRAEGKGDHWAPNKAELLRAIENYHKLSDRYGKPTIRLQCALRYLYPDTLKTNPCDAVTNSFGINWQGNLLLSAWANNSSGDVLDDAFVLGDLTSQTLSHIRSSDKVTRYLERVNDNFGHCKIFAFVHSNDSTENALFRSTDPLYTTRD